MTTYTLYAKTRNAFESSKHSQREVARALGVNVSSVSRALRNKGMKHAAMQACILSLLKNIPVQRRSTYAGAYVEHKWVMGS